MERRKRIALSVPPEIDEVLEHISALTQQPKTRIILDLLEQTVPVMQQTLEALIQIQENKENATAIAKKFGHEILLSGNQTLGEIANEVKNLK